MKLLELTGIKKHEDKSLADFFSSLIIKRKIDIESGAFGFTVLPTDNRGYIWKVWLNDEGFDEYLRWATANQSNPHALKIIRKKTQIPFTFKRPDWLDIKFNVVRVERLFPLRRQANGKGDQVQAFYRVDDWAHDYEGNLTKETIEELIERVEKETKIKVPKSYVETHLHFRKYSQGDEFEHDLSVDNVMARADGTFVITDPLYKPGTLEKVTAAEILDDSFSKDEEGYVPKSPKHGR